MGLPIHIIATTLSRRKREYPLSIPEGKTPISLDGILSDRVQTMEGKIVKVRPRMIDYDAPPGSGYYTFIYFFIKDGNRKVHKLLQPIPTLSTYKDPIKSYMNQDVSIRYRELINGKILSEHLVENFIWPFTSKSYPVLYNIKADGIIVDGVDLKKIGL